MSITNETAEEARKKLETFYQSRVPEGKITLRQCEVPEVFIHVGEEPSKYAAEVLVNGFPIPTPVQDMHICNKDGDKTVKTPSTFTVSLDEAHRAMEHLKSFGYPETLQFESEVPLIKEVANRGLPLPPGTSEPAGLGKFLE